MRRLLGIGLLVMLALPCAAGQRSDVLTKCLKNQAAVYVYAENVTPALKDARVSVDDLVMWAELRLRAVGIKVISKDDLAQYPNGPCLYVHVNAMPVRDSGFTCFYASVQFGNTVVLLTKGSPAHPSATLWEEGSLGWYSGNGKASVKEVVDGLADQFANEFLKANPKQ